MKVGLFLFFLLHLQDALSERVLFQPSKAVEYSYPKKGSRKNAKILISRKLFTPKNLHTKKANIINNGYTAFPALGDLDKKLYDKPDSPFFPHDPNNEQEARVKKVLPDYIIGAVRRKRSDVNAKDEIKKSIQKTPGGKVVNPPTQVETESQAKKKPAQRPKGKEVVQTPNNRTSLTKNEPRNRKRIRKSNKQFRGQKRKKNNANTTRNKLKNRPSRLHRRKRILRKRNNGKVAKKSRKSRTNLTRVPIKANESRRLIAAKDAIIEDYPYTVSIQKNNQHWCAGALLNPRLVITTANCVWKSTRVSRLKVRAGSRHTDQGGQTAKIQEVMKHPAWSIRTNPDNDVAILLLDRKIKFSDSVHSVDLPNRIMMPAFEDAWVTSWGSERRDGMYDKPLGLQAFHTRLLDRAKCNNITERFGITVTRNFICLSQMGRRAPCTRDTGAPAVSDGVLWGLASWGIRKLCGTQRFPAMFSYIASQTNMDFIMNATRHLMSDERHYPFPDRYLRASDPVKRRPELNFPR